MISIFTRVFKKSHEVISENKLFFMTILIGLCVRALWIIAVPTVPISDFLLYHEGAISIVQGNGFRIYGEYLTAYEPIGYPALLALLYKIFGVNIIVGKIANILIATGSLALVYLIVDKGLKNKKAAIFAMFLVAVLPLNVSYTSVLSTEITFTVFFLLVIYIMLLPNKKISTYVYLGIILGILSLVKPYMMVFQFVILAIEVFDTRKLKKPLVNLLIITAFMILTIAPWTIRNYFVFNKVIPISTNGGYNLYLNNNDYATGGWQDPFLIPNTPLLKYKHVNDDFWDEVKVDEEGKKLAYNWIKNNPDKFVNVGFKKLNRMFVIPDNGHWATNNLPNHKPFRYRDLLEEINKKIHYVTAFFVLIYFVILIRKLIKRQKIETLHIIIIMNFAFYFAITFVFEGQFRYLFPLWPVFMIVITYVLWFTKEQINERHKGIAK